jgi:HK97 gp10 family phage protein
VAEVRGLAQFKRNVATLKDQVELRAAVRAVEAGAAIFQRGMSARAPRETGQLASDILVELHVIRGAIVARVGPSRRSFYGTFLEFGTRYRAAHPFVRPTLDEDSTPVRTTMDREFRAAIDAAARHLSV